MEIEIFSNPSFGQVRVAGTSDQPLFCLADVCKSLDIKNSRDCRTRLNEKGVVTTDILTNGGTQRMTFITESNLYKCIFQSRRPDANTFQLWVCQDVLPAIRKHGAYMTAETLEKALTSPDFLIKLATNLKVEQQKRMAAETTIELNRPKVLFASAVETSQKSILVGELAKIIQQNGVNMGRDRLFKWMRDNGYLCKYNESYNQPTQKAMELKLFEIKKTTITKPNGNTLITTTTKVTGKGQIYFVDKLLSDVRQNIA